MEEDKNQLERRCPRLGNSVSFHYCMTCGEDTLPCFKLSDCWWEHFDVAAYLKTKLTEEQFDRFICSKPKPKVASLLDLIEQAKERLKK
ncbi:MAG: hypothetical protein BWK80_09475 [Desulfobacteraceae bacterium IS3]|nr:MAG: hypothetical protein BWK80_09475 [Desulfobacteraceae bacterium IS3]